MAKKVSISQRFIQFLAEIGDSDRKAASKIGVTHGWIGGIRRGASMGTDKLERILEVYPELNRRWLIDGSGVMVHDEETAYKSSEVNRILNELKAKGADDELINELGALIARLEDERSEVQGELMAMMRKLNGK